MNKKRAQTKAERKRRSLNRKSRTQYRLRDRLWTDQAKPMFAAGNIRYELAERVRGLGPGACGGSYRMVVVRKNLSVEKGDAVLFDDLRYFFYITNNRTMAPSGIVRSANDRCNQENLIKQLKQGARALQMPVDNLLSNWADMVMASLAWTLKAWFAFLLPEGGRWKQKRRQEKTAVLRMGFKRFVNAFVRVPCQVVQAGRGLIYRLLAWNPWQTVFLRGADALQAMSRWRYPLRC